MNVPKTIKAIKNKMEAKMPITFLPMVVSKFSLFAVEVLGLFVGTGLFAVFPVEIF